MDTSASGGYDGDGRKGLEVCLFFHYMHVSLCECEYRFPRRLRLSRAEFPETGVTGSCEPPSLDAGN